MLGLKLLNDYQVYSFKSPTTQSNHISFGATTSNRLLEDSEAAQEEQLITRVFFFCFYFCDCLNKWNNFFYLQVPEMHFFSQQEFNSFQVHSVLTTSLSYLNCVFYADVCGDEAFCHKASHNTGLTVSIIQ